MDKNKLIDTLLAHKSRYPEERHFVPRFISLLHNFQNCFSRTLLSGHITASSFIVCSNGRNVLLVHHRKLNKWLQPGGHADGEQNVLCVAEKEAVEETGLQSLRLVSKDIYDIDIHVIPKYREVRAHFHYDVRYLFTADASEKIRVSHESHDVAWIPLHMAADAAGGNRSIMRMCDKLSQIRSPRSIMHI